MNTVISTNERALLLKIFDDLLRGNIIQKRQTPKTKKSKKRKYRFKPGDATSDNENETEEERRARLRRKVTTAEKLQKIYFP